MKRGYLDIINSIWQIGEISEQWERDLVMSLPKAGQDSKVALNIAGYNRSISFLSCAAKVMDGILNAQTN